MNTQEVRGQMAQVKEPKAFIVVKNLCCKKKCFHVFDDLIDKINCVDSSTLDQVREDVCDSECKEFIDRFDSFAIDKGLKKEIYIYQIEDLEKRLNMNYKRIDVLNREVKQKENNISIITKKIKFLKEQTGNNQVEKNMRLLNDLIDHEMNK